MNKKPPKRPGITFEVGAKVEAQDYLKKWYPARIEKVEPKEGRLLVHFDRWSHRYDEWISWDSRRLRPLEKNTLYREGVNVEDSEAVRRTLPHSTYSPQTDTATEQKTQELQDGEEVLARWTDCRYYPAKIEAVNKEGTYTVQFYDGVVRSVKRIHIKSMPEDAKGQDWVALVKAATAAWTKDCSQKDANRQKEEEPIEEEKDKRGKLEQKETLLLQEVTEAPVECVGMTSVTDSSIQDHHHNHSVLKSLRSPDHPCLTCEDPIQFHCTLPGCFKTFRKAKLLDYHFKYYHSSQTQHTEETCLTPSTTLPPSSIRPTFSPASTPSPQRAACCSVKRKRPFPTSVSSASRELLTMTTLSHLPMVPFPLSASGRLNHQGVIRTSLDPERRDKRGWKESDSLKVKQKKKKFKQNGEYMLHKRRDKGYHNYEGISLSPLNRSALHHQNDNTFSFHPSCSSKLLQYPRAILQVDLTGENQSEGEYLDDSTTESLPFSSEELDLEDDETALERSPVNQDIIRCICQMDEENGFMIQCEDCMCWQHSLCMGLPEDSIPDQYSCYICKDPPGQRWSAKFCHVRDWLVRGHMFGLSVLEKNYSKQNSHQIISTHQLLANLLTLEHILHGLTLKMDILQDHHSPSLHLWTRSWVNSDEHQPMGGQPGYLTAYPTSSAPHSSLPCFSAPALHHTYITNEHSYQKPIDPAHSNNYDLTPTPSFQGILTRSSAICSVQKSKEQPVVVFSGNPAQAELQATTRSRACVQWQMNLLTHIEDVQSQLVSRMDVIEKEVDVLESWFELSDDLEPASTTMQPLHLKLSIKQLLRDLGKLHRISTLCSV